MSDLFDLHALDRLDMFERLSRQMDAIARDLASRARPQGGGIVIDLARAVGVLPPVNLPIVDVPHGGTGDTTLATNGVLFGNAAGAVQVTAQGPANSVLTANAGAPVFSDTPTTTSFATSTGNITSGQSFVAVRNVRAGSTFNIGMTGRSVIASSADGLLELLNNTLNGFTRLNFGGTTASFPALKLNALALDVRLADDSDYTTLNAKLVQSLGTGTGLAKASATLLTTVTGLQTGANTNETTGSTFSLPANALGTDGSSVEVTAYFRTAANANTKRFRLYFGASVVVDTTAQAMNNLTGVIRYTVFRQNGTLQVGGGDWVASVSNSGGSAVLIGNGFAAPAETLSGAVTIKSTMQNGSPTAGDCTLDSLLIRYQPA